MLWSGINASQVSLEIVAYRNSDEETDEQRF
jgi:hypothetical protein